MRSLNGAGRQLDSSEAQLEPIGWKLGGGGGGRAGSRCKFRPRSTRLAGERNFSLTDAKLAQQTGRPPVAPRPPRTEPIGQLASPLCTVGRLTCHWRLGGGGGGGRAATPEAPAAGRLLWRRLAASGAPSPSANSITSRHSMAHSLAKWASHAMASSMEPIYQ